MMHRYVRLSKKTDSELQKLKSKVIKAYESDSLNLTTREIYYSCMRILDYHMGVKYDIADLKAELSKTSGGYDSGSAFDGVPMLVDYKNTKRGSKNWKLKEGQS